MPERLSWRRDDPSTDLLNGSLPPDARDAPERAEAGARRSGGARAERGGDWMGGYSRWKVKGRVKAGGRPRRRARRTVDVCEKSCSTWEGGGRVRSDGEAPTKWKAAELERVRTLARATPTDICLRAAARSGTASSARFFAVRGAFGLNEQRGGGPHSMGGMWDFRSCRRRACFHATPPSMVPAPRCRRRVPAFRV